MSCCGKPTDPESEPQGQPERRGVGDSLAARLASVGITEERVSEWLGRPCGCTERKAKLNKLGEWAKIQGRLTADKARYVLELILG